MRALVCGAGIAGLTVAWWLHRDGWEVTLVEGAESARPGGYMMDFFGSGYDVAEAMGLLPALGRAQTLIEGLTYLDSSGRRRAGTSYDTLSRAFDGRVVSLMRGDLERALREAFDPPPPIRYGTTVARIDAREAPGGAQVHLADGHRERVDLVVGADGIHSRVRGLVHGPEREVLRPLGFHTASFIFDAPDVLAAIGRSFTIVAEPGRQAGVYPTGDGRAATSLIHATTAGVPGGQRDRADAVRHAYRNLGDLVDGVLSYCPEDSSLYYDRVAQVELAGWSRGPVTLVGDACGAVSVMAGQGASMAMGGAWLLADELRRSPDDLTGALQRYEHRMQPFVQRKQTYGRSTARWLVPHSRWRMALRDSALRISNVPGGSRLLRPALAVARESVVHG